MSNTVFSINNANIVNVSFNLSFEIIPIELAKTITINDKTYQQGQKIDTEVLKMLLANNHQTNIISFLPRSKRVMYFSTEDKKGTTIAKLKECNEQQNKAIGVIFGKYC